MMPLPRAAARARVLLTCPHWAAVSTSFWLLPPSGVYTDNQPDFSWLAPGETKNFSQYW